MFAELSITNARVAARHSDYDIKLSSCMGRVGGRSRVSLIEGDITFTKVWSG